MKIIDDPTFSPTTRRPRRRPSRWRALAVCGVAAFGLGGASVPTAQAQRSPDARVATAPAMRLTIDTPLALLCCLAPRADEPIEAPVAFSGTVTAVEDGNPRLTVDRWYRGGQAQTVVLEHADHGGGAQQFELGERYLVAAGERSVDQCTTGRWSPSRAAAFQRALTGRTDRAAGPH